MRQFQTVDGRDPAGGIMLSWAQFAVGIASFVVSLVTPLLMFINQTNVNIALLNERIGRQEDVLRKLADTQAGTDARMFGIEGRLLRVEAGSAAQTPPRKERRTWD